MIPSLRRAFNSNYKAEKYPALLRRLEEQCEGPVEFRVSETPVFLPARLLEGMAESGKELIRQLVESAEYRKRSEASIPPEFRVAQESAHPMFVQVDFGLVRDARGDLQSKLVELQAFPSLYAYQPVLARAYLENYELDRNLKYYLSGLDDGSYRELLRRAVLGQCDPENVILMEIDPEHQKTRPDFRMTEKLLGIRTVDIRKVRKSGGGLIGAAGGGWPFRGFKNGGLWVNWRGRA